MRLWSDYTNIDFKEISESNPDILIKFASGYHNDPFAFDGVGGTLAHAFYPHNGIGFSGDVHFDVAEDYRSGNGNRFLWTITHELGKLLCGPVSPASTPVFFLPFPSVKPNLWARDCIYVQVTSSPFRIKNTSKKLQSEYWLLELFL